MLLALAHIVLCATITGQPACARTLRSCVYLRSGVDFGDGLQVLSTQRELAYRPGPQLSNMCNPANWVERDACYTSACALRFEVTEPAAYRMSVCVTDTEFEPFLEESHITPDHPLEGKELELVVLGSNSSTRKSCSPTDYADGKDYRGKLVLFFRGTCLFYLKFAYAKQAGAASALMVDTNSEPSILRQTVSMVGVAEPSAGLPGGHIPRHHGTLLLEALSQGTVVKGRYVASCPEVGATSAPSRPEDLPDSTILGSCPHPGLIRKCDGEQYSEHRLCSRCPMEAVHSSYPDLRFCLWPSDLLPRKAENVLWHLRSLPVRITLTYVVPNADTTWCNASDFQGLEGKVVVLTLPTRCLPFESARAAQSAGAAGFIMLSPSYLATTQPVEGLSAFVRIPVHTVEPRNWGVIDSTFRSRGVPHTGSGYTRFDLSVTGALGDEPPPAAPANGTGYGVRFFIDASALPPNGAYSLEYSPSIAVNTLLMVFLLGVCVMLIAMQRSAASKLQTVISPEGGAASGSQAGGEGGSVARDTIAVPLSVASLGLSLSLIVIVAVVTFVLAFNAGVDAKNDALSQSKRASEENYRSAVMNTNDIAFQLRTSVMLQVTRGLAAILGQGEQMASSVAALYFESNTSWNTFADKYSSLVQLMRRNPNWKATVLTENGYLFALKKKTTEEYPGYPHISKTNNGYPYGTTRMYYNAALGQNDPRTSYPPHDYDMFYRVGACLGNPFEFTRDLPDRSFKWHLTHKTCISEEDEAIGYSAPLTVYTPLFNSRREYLGTVQADLGLDVLAAILGEAMTPPSAVNMTIVVMDSETQHIVASTAYHHSRRYMQINVLTMLSMNSLYTLDDIPPVQLLALGHFLYQYKHMDSLENATALQGLGLQGGLGIAPHLSVQPEGTDSHRHSHGHDMDGVDQVHGDYSGDDVHSRMAHLAEGISVEIDQKDFFREPSHHFLVMDVMAGEEAGSSPSDFSYNDFTVSVEGCGGAGLPCGVVRRDGEPAAMAFDGSGQVEVAKYLKTTHPDVAATRIGTGSDPWRSSFSAYNYTMPVPSQPDKTCIGFAEAVADVPSRCMLQQPFLEQSYSIFVKFYPHEDIDPYDVDQRLFGDSGEGAGLLRLHASGHLKVGVLSYACRTDLFRSAITGGRWHSIAAVVDRLKMTCTVYFDGQRVSQGKIATTDGNGMFADQSRTPPYVIGQGFRGEIARLRVWERPIEPEEVEVLHRTGEMVRHVPSRRWYAQTQGFVRKSSASTMDWMVGVMIPRDDVMRHIDLNNLVSQRNLEIQSEALNNRLWQKNIETVFIISVLCLASVIVFLIFNDAITRPFAQIATLMTEAAVLRIDEIPEQTSHILELNAIQSAMVLMLKNLREYRAYIPQSVLADSTDDGADEDSAKASSSKGYRASRPRELGSAVGSINAVAIGGGGGLPTSPGTTAGPVTSLRVVSFNNGHHQGSAGGGSHCSPSHVNLLNNGLNSPTNSITLLHNPSGSTFSAFGGSDTPMNAVPREMVSVGSPRGSISNASLASDNGSDMPVFGSQRLAMALSLHKRRISFVVVNICDWHAKVLSLSEARTLSLHTLVLQKVLDAFAGERGISEVFSGDRFLCSFNAARQVAHHRLRACAAACRVRDTLRDENISISSAVVCGEGRVGNMGCGAMKKFSFVTPVLTWAYALERYARSLNIPVLCDSWIYSETIDSCFMKIIGAVWFRKRHQRRIVLAELVGRRGGAPGGRNSRQSSDWMYQAQGAGDPHLGWNKFVHHVLGEDWQEAKNLMYHVCDSESSKVYAQLCNAISHKEYTVPEILYH